MDDNTGYALRVCVLFALPEEAAPFRKQRHSFGWVVSLGVSGPGFANAATHAGLLLDDPGPKIKCLIVCGFAGGLDPDLVPGDLLVANQVLRDLEPPLQPDAELLAAANSFCLPGYIPCMAPLITGDRVLISAAEKRALFAKTPAVAVDMETYGAVTAAEERGIPWLAVRVITDGAQHELPLDFNAFTAPDGSLNRGRIVAATLARPWKIPAMAQLGKRSKQAAGNLAVFLESLLQALPD